MKKPLLALLVLVAVIGAVVSGQERITLTSAETVPNNQAYRVESIHIQVDDPDILADTGRITIQLMGVEQRKPVTCTYTPTTNPTGTVLINALNKANLSSTYNNNATTGSLVQRIFHRLVVMNEGPAICGRALTGTLTGSPQ